MFKSKTEVQIVLTSLFAILLNHSPGNKCSTALKSFIKVTALVWKEGFFLIVNLKIWSEIGVIGDSKPHCE